MALKKRAIGDQVFCIRDPDGGPCWQAIVGGELVRADFNSKGAAQAAIPVERARMAKRAARAAAAGQGGGGRDEGLGRA